MTSSPDDRAAAWTRTGSREMTDDGATGSSSFRNFREHVRADHAALMRSDAKYGHVHSESHTSIVLDAVRRIGFQMLIAYRLMRLLRALHLTLFAMMLSRLIRHLYAAEVHWEAQLAPGVVLVHGNGLVLSREARVGPGCIIFQSVTLGVSVDAVTRLVGGPTLEADVHVGPGAALLGPITIGRNTKIMANAVVMTSVPADSVVEVAAPLIRPRIKHGGGPTELPNY